MATSAIRCLRCNREVARNPPFCDDCERWLREAVELRKRGVVALKDHRTGDFQVKISHEPLCGSSDWCEELCGAIKKLKPIKTLEMSAGGEYVEDLLASIEEGPALLALHLPKTELTDRGLERIRQFVSLEAYGSLVFVGGLGNP